jgi:hypothetical protein
MNTETKLTLAWSMPSRWTFQMKPVAEFLARHLPPNGVIVDPFCGTSTLATHSNDLGQGGMDAADWCKKLADEGVVADAVLFDPPYSPRQIAECYKGIGRKVGMKDTQSAVLYAEVRKPLAAILRYGGVALSFGWNSAGFSTKWPTQEILLVRHGGAHNDTICVAQTKPFNLFHIQ